MAKSKRMHKYHRIEINGNLTWACALPDCNHYMPPHLENNLKNKITICWDCNEPIARLDETNWKLTQPICEACRAIKISSGQVELTEAEKIDESVVNSLLKLFDKKKDKENIESFNSGLIGD